VFKNAKVGDRVWDSVWGWGVISKVCLNVFVRFNSGGGRTYATSGYIDEGEAYPHLFWGPCCPADESTWPKRPKRIVKKSITKWGVCKHRISDHISNVQSWYLSGSGMQPRLWDTEKEAEKEVGANSSKPFPITFEWEEEVN